MCCWLSGGFFFICSNSAILTSLFPQTTYRFLSASFAADLNLMELVTTKCSPTLILLLFIFKKASFFYSSNGHYI